MRYKIVDVDGSTVIEFETDEALLYGVTNLEKNLEREGAGLNYKCMNAGREVLVRFTSNVTLPLGPANIQPVEE